MVNFIFTEYHILLDSYHIMLSLSTEYYKAVSRIIARFPIISAFVKHNVFLFLIFFWAHRVV